MRVSIRSNKGFSLVELMVVVAIIGILAAIAVPNFQRFTAKSKQSEAKSSLSAMYSAERALSSEWQTFAASFDVIGYRPTGWQRYNHGFAANFPAAMPPGYAGPPITANFNTTAFCGLGAIGANGCGVINAPIAPGAVTAGGVTGSAMAIATFQAVSRAHIGNAAPATIDIWTINQNKVIANAANGLP